MVFASLNLEGEARTELQGPRPAGAEVLPRPTCRFAKVATGQVLRGTVIGQVGEVEDVEDLEDALNVEALADLEGLGDANVFGVEVIAEAEILRHNHSRDRGPHSVLLPGKVYIVLVDQLQELASADAAIEAVRLQPRQGVVGRS